MKKLTSLALLAGVAAASALTPTMAQAGPIIGAPCADVKDVTGPHFDVKLCDVPDIDQFRTNLAGNGNSHCGPASLYNILYYLNAKKGLPVKITPNGQTMTEYVWNNPSVYPIVTAWLGWLGDKAGMPNGGGSSAGENRAAFDAATLSAKNSNWFLNRGQTDAHTTPEFGFEMAKKLSHAPVQMWYGRYTQNADLSVSRGGGHIVTVVSAKGDLNSGKVELTLADPGRAADHKKPGYLDTQSSARYEKVTLNRMAVNVKVTPDDGSAPYNVQRTYWRLTGENYVADTIQFVEGFNWFQAAPPVG